MVPGFCDPFFYWWYEKPIFGILINLWFSFIPCFNIFWKKNEQTEFLKWKSFVRENVFILEWNEGRDDNGGLSRNKKSVIRSNGFIYLNLIPL